MSDDAEQVRLWGHVHDAPELTVDDRDAPRSPFEPYRSTKDVLAQLRIDAKTLRRLQRDTKRSGVRPAFVDYGSSRPRYRWRDPLAVSKWFEGVSAWRRTAREAKGTSSAGEKKRADGGKGRSRTEPQRSSSNESSAAVEFRDVDGKVVRLPRRG